MSDDLTKIIEVTPELSLLDYAGSVPDDEEIILSSTKSGSDPFNVLVWGRGVPNPLYPGDGQPNPDNETKFIGPSITYDTLYGLFNTGVAQITYSGINRYNTPKYVSGWFLPIENVINSVYNTFSYPPGQQGGPVGSAFALTDLTTSVVNSVVTLTSEDFTVKILGSQIGYDRYYYVNPTDLQGSGTTRFAGFLMNGTSSNYSIRFVMGQVAPNEQQWFTFASLNEGGFTLDINSAASLPQWGIITAYYKDPLGEIIPVLPMPSSDTININSGDPIKFNIYGWDYLNQPRLYITYGLVSGVRPNPPDITKDPFYNLQSPVFVGGEWDYPNGLVITNSTSSTQTYVIRVMAYAPGALNSIVYDFTANIAP